MDYNPQVTFPCKVPKQDSPLSSIAGGYIFKTYIVLYSDNLPYSYSALGVAEWSVSFDGEVKDGKWSPVMKDLTLGTNELNVYYDSKDPQQAGCEVRPPSFTQYFSPIEDLDAEDTEDSKNGKYNELHRKILPMVIMSEDLVLLIRLLLAT